MATPSPTTTTWAAAVRPTQIEHTFAEEIPEVVQPDVLYVSLMYATAAHICPCGCGGEVFTPFSPTYWAMTFDGETVSLHPSISNRICPKRSHYWIKRNRVEWSAPVPPRSPSARRWLPLRFTRWIERRLMASEDFLKPRHRQPREDWK